MLQLLSKIPLVNWISLHKASQWNEIEKLKNKNYNYNKQQTTSATNATWKCACVLKDCVFEMSSGTTHMSNMAVCDKLSNKLVTKQAKRAGRLQGVLSESTTLLQIRERMPDSSQASPILWAQHTRPYRPLASKLNLNRQKRCLAALFHCVGTPTHRPTAQLPLLLLCAAWLLQFGIFYMPVPLLLLLHFLCAIFSQLFSCILFESPLSSRVKKKKKNRQTCAHTVNARKK